VQYGETPLHMAAKNGCNEAAKLLLSHGAFVEAKANVRIFDVSPPPLYSKLRKIWNNTLVSLCVCCAEWNDTLASCCLALASIR